MKQIFILVLAIVSFLIGEQRVSAARIKDLAVLQGVRDNQLVGYGLVVGLAGTGDRRQTIFPMQSLANMLDRLGVSIPANAMQVRNTAAVMVTANLPPYSQPGARIDVTVAAMGDAVSLQGGLLVMTALRAANNQIYAVAQGPLVLSSFVAGAVGNTRTLNHPNTARIPEGAIVEQPAPTVEIGSSISLRLRQADFTTASRMADSINQKFSGAARAESAGIVVVSPPAEFSGRSTELVAAIEQLDVQVDRLERIVVNERTGTIVLGKNVRIAPVAVMHGGLSVEIRTAFDVSQPRPFSRGNSTVVPQVQTEVREEAARQITLREGSSVDELIRGLAAIGSTPRDIIAILQALRSAGALDATIEVI